jgi:hypothetical protein
MLRVKVKPVVPTVVTPFLPPKPVATPPDPFFTQPQLPPGDVKQYSV